MRTISSIEQLQRENTVLQEQIEAERKDREEKVASQKNTYDQLVGALEQGAERVLLSSDTHQLAERAVEGLDGPVEFVESPLTGSHLDTIAAARSMWKEQAGAIVALGGDGQVTMGETVMKANARKVRRLYKDNVIAGFAGGTADGFTLVERFEGKLEKRSLCLSRGDYS